MDSLCHLQPILRPLLSSGSDIFDELADYYCMLPVLSASLSGVIHNNCDFLSEIQPCAILLLPIAVKLRHATLFRECLIFCLGPYNAPEYHHLEDPKLRDLAASASTRLTVYLGRTQETLLARGTSDNSSDGLKSKLKMHILSNVAVEVRKPYRELHFPVYYRQLSKTLVDRKCPFQGDVGLLWIVIWIWCVGRNPARVTAKHTS
jgi:hypothetical protein